MKKIMFIAAALVVTNIHPTESKPNTKPKPVEDFSSFMAKNYPTLDAYLKSNEFNYKQVKDWPNKGGAALWPVYVQTIQSPAFEIKDSETKSQVHLRAFEVITEFADLWNKYGENSELPQNKKEKVQKNLDTYFTISIFTLKIPQYHNESFFAIWKSAKTIEDRSNAIIYLVNTVAATCRANASRPACYHAMDTIIQFIHDHEATCTPFARDLVKEQIKKILNEQLKSNDSLNPARKLIKEFGW